MSKIAVVIPKYGLVGGAEQFTALLTDQLCNRTDHTFQVFANRWQSNSDAIRFQKIPIVSFPKFLTTISFAWFVQKKLQRETFDLVHSHERIFRADLFTLHGIPHRYWIHHIRQKHMSLYDRATAWVEEKLVCDGQCRKFIAVSELTKQIFLQEYRIDPDRVVVIHPGVHLPDHSPNLKNRVRGTIRRELGIRDEDIVIVFASMNFEIKGLDSILHSLARLKSGFKLIVAGKGNTGKYQKIAGEAGIAGNVIFTGVVSKERLTDLYLAGDLYMMLSKFDTFGMVVLEAMAAGLPVIVSHNVGAKDLIEEGINGFVITDPADANHVASKIQSLADEKNRRGMSAHAYRTASQNTWDTVATKYAGLYAEVLETKNRKA